MKTHEEHVRRVRAQHGDAIKVVGTYTHSRIKVDYECPTHGTWLAYAHNVERGTGCPRCAVDARRTTPDEHRACVREIHGDRLRVVDDYIDAHTKIRYECPEHGVFQAQPANVVHLRSGCRRCFSATISDRCRKKHGTYVEEARASGVEVLDTYVGAHEPIRHRCSKGHVWETKPNQLLSGYGCPRCDQSQYRRRQIVVGERTVLVQGAEGKAVEILLSEGVEPSDLAFLKTEGLPTFRYRFDGSWRTYIPDFYRCSLDQVIEVKSLQTLGYYDADLYAQVRAKARAALRAGHDYRLMVIHRGRLLELGRGWHRLSWEKIVDRIRKRSRAQDRRFGRGGRS